MIVGGVLQSTFGEPTIRSTNAGVGFLGVRIRRAADAEPTATWTCAPSCFIRGTATSRSSGRTAGSSATTAIRRRARPLLHAVHDHRAAARRCSAAVPSRLYFLNKGLQTLQFYNVVARSAESAEAADRRPAGQQHGLAGRHGQAAGVEDAVSRRRRHVGVGVSSARSGDPVRELPEQQLLHELPQRRHRAGGCARTIRFKSRPSAKASRSRRAGSSSRSTRRGPTRSSRRFQHVWRTQDNGGPQAFLEANCKMSGGTSGPHLRRLGSARRARFRSRPAATPDSASRKPGDLTSDFYGTDRTGGLIVSAERTPADTGTLWAATNMGRLFVAKGVDGAAADVEFVRIDTPATPNRFVTRIAVDRFDPNVAYISYSGFQRAHAGHAGPHLPRGLRPGQRTRVIHVRRLRPRRHARSTRSRSTTCAAICTRPRTSARSCCART